jgi:hypothetical protein
LSYELDDRKIKVRFLAGTRDLSHIQSVKIGSGTHTAFYVIVTVASLPGWRVKRLGCETDDATSSGAEVKNSWSHTANSVYFTQGAVLNYS